MTPARERWLRLVLTFALAVLVVDRMTDWTWPGLVPVTGLLLAGAAGLLAARAASALTATGSDGRERSGTAVRAELVRLLVPFWLFAAFTVTLLVTSDRFRADPETVWLWALPLAEPPVPRSAAAWVGSLDLVVAWLWFVLLSPPLLWLARRWPLRLMSVPVLVLLPISVGLATGDGRVHDVLVTLCTFACCWVLGFVYADGRLTRMPVTVALVVGGAAIGAGLWVAGVQREQYAAAEPADVPLASLLLGVGVVLLLLRAQPAGAVLRHLPPVNAVLRFLTDRTLTVVLWTGPVVAAAPLVVAAYEPAEWVGPATPWLLLFGVVLTLGWAERLGALARRRRPAPARAYVFEGNGVADPARADARDL
jgi:hypothetical protein